MQTQNIFKSQLLKPEIYMGAKSSGMNFVACSAITVRAEFWQAWPYNEEIKIGEDQDFNSRIAAGGLNLSYIPDDLSVYVTTSRTEFDCMCEICEKLRPVECLPEPIDIEKVIKKRDELHKRLINLEQISKSMQAIASLLPVLKNVNKRITELESSRD
jgi:hypothetical protein